MAAKEFHCDVDLKGALLLGGDPGEAGQIPYSGGPGEPATWAAPPAAGGISDGDKGDITVSGSGATWTIDNDAVTYAKLQNVSAANRILGRSSAGAGNVEEITVGAGLSLSGGTLSASGAPQVDYGLVTETTSSTVDYGSLI
jgi:hypothetical protein